MFSHIIPENRERFRVNKFRCLAVRVRVREQEKIVKIYCKVEEEDPIKWKFVCYSLFKDPTQGKFWLGEEHIYIQAWFSLNFVYLNEEIDVYSEEYIKIYIYRCIRVCTRWGGRLEEGEEFSSSVSKRVKGSHHREASTDLVVAAWSAEVEGAAIKESSSTHVRKWKSELEYWKLEDREREAALLCFEV